MILCIETSTETFSVALEDDSGSADLQLSHRMARSQHIVSAVDFLLSRMGMNIHDVEAAYAGTGPGSFTGIRIGLSFVNALRQAQGIPVGGMSTLDVLAYGMSRWYNSIIPLIRSRKGEAFTSLYRSGVRAAGYTLVRREDLARFIRENNPACVVTARSTADELLGDEGYRALPEGTVLEFSAPHAKTILRMVREGIRPAYGRDGYLSPLYLRGF
jgi:tRNA threonylcarbamoyl adenosine modification protein YeaZ